MNNLPTLFDERALSDNERTYLLQKEIRIKSIVMQSASEIGKELLEVRAWFAENHKRGFEAWVERTFDFTHRHAHRLMEIAEALPEGTYMSLLGMAMTTQLELVKAPDPQTAVDEALLRQQIEGEITAKKAKEIAEYQRAEQIAKDTARSSQDRAAALDRQLAYVKLQLTEVQKAKELAEERAKKAAEHKPQVIEKIVEKPVVPPGIQEHIHKLEEKQKLLQRERDSYRQQLHEERSVAQAKILEDLEGENADRINVKFADAMRDYVNSIRVALSSLPSLMDTQVFDADSWQRLDEAIEKNAHMGQELQKLKHYVSSEKRMVVIDSGMPQLWQ